MTDKDTGAPQSDPLASLRQAGEALGKSLSAAFELTGRLITVNSAVGNLFRQEEDKAREALGKLPDAFLRQVETNGRRLARLAQQVRQARAEQ